MTGVEMSSIRDKVRIHSQVNDVREALKWEKQLKNWKRSWKVELVEKEDGNWVDLFDGWYGDAGSTCMYWFKQQTNQLKSLPPLGDRKTNNLSLN